MGHFEQKMVSKLVSENDVMCRDQPMRHDHVCVSGKAKCFRSFKDYVVQLVTICGNIILEYLV